MKNMRTLLITIPVILIAVILVAVKPIQLTPEQENKPSLEGATGWLNTAPLKLKQLRGKVVLIDFWTYTCINWRRSLPYVRAWADKYKDYGLVVIGVHSPEFEFEQDFGNVQRAVKNIGVGHPVAIDSDHAVWRAFMNQYW